MDKETLLKYAIDNDILDVATIQEQIAMNERKKYLLQHDKRIYQDKDGNWNTYLHSDEFKNGRKLIRKRELKQLQDEIVDFYKKKEENPTLKSTFYMWLNEKLEFGEISKQTYHRYETDFTRFFSKDGIMDKKIPFISENEIERFIKTSIKEKELTAKAWSGLKIIINGTFKYAKKHGYTTISISSFLGDLTIPKKAFKRRVFTDEESVFFDDEKAKIRLFVHENMCSDMLALGILLTFETGLRVGELCALKYSDLNGSVLNVCRTEIHYKKENGKGYEYEVREFTKGSEGFRQVIVTNEAIRLIEQIHRMNPFGEYLFMKNQERIKEFSFCYRIRSICKKLNIKERSMHKIRKTYATDLFNAGVDEKLIIDQMGHTDITTTKTHYRFNNRNVEQKASIINKAMS